MTQELSTLAFCYRQDTASLLVTSICYVLQPLLARWRPSCPPRHAIRGLLLRWRVPPAVRIWPTSFAGMATLATSCLSFGAISTYSHSASARWSSSRRTGITTRTLYLPMTCCRAWRRVRITWAWACCSVCQLLWSCLLLQLYRFTL